MADTISGNDAAGSTSDSWSTRLRSRCSWRRAIESISMPDMSATMSSRCTSSGETSATTAAVAEHDHPVGQREDLIEVVGHQQDARPGVAALTDHALHPQRLGDAERRRGLVEQQQPRVAHERPTERHELALTARQAAHRPVQRQRLGPHPPQDRRGVLAHLALGDHPATRLAAQEHVGDDVEVVAQPVVLPQHLDPGLAHLIGRRGQRRAVEPDLALLGLEDAGDAGHQRRLARAVLADQGDDLARTDPQVHVAQHREAAEALGDPAGVEARHAVADGRSSLRTALASVTRTLRRRRSGRRR